MKQRLSVIGFLAAGLAFMPALESRHNGPLPYHLEAGSQLWINGTATIGSYRCGTVAVYGAADLDTNHDELNEPDPPESNARGNARVEILVKMFDCGNPAMNRDMYAALKANRDPTIQYKLTGAEVIFDSTAAIGLLRLRTIGDLSIAGVTRKDTVIADVRSLTNGKYEIIGKKNLSMHDYKIVPPSAFFGLIRAHEGLTVSFDLIAAPDEEGVLQNTGRAMR
jgi:hypothetical protein